MSRRQLIRHGAWFGAAVAATQAIHSQVFNAENNIQLHGGIGFTWEHDAHLYFKRARASESLFGSPQSHREAVAKLWLDATAADGA